MNEHVLDNPVWHSLTGAHRRFGTRQGAAAHYHADFALSAGLADGSGWADLAAISKPGTTYRFSTVPTLPPRNWTILLEMPVLQMVGLDVAAADDPDAVVLTTDDVPAMTDLVARTEPGPFRPRTVELGTYLGVRHRGKLAAMAGERFHPPGFTEISAVCVEKTLRRNGLARRLVGALAAGICKRDEIPILHVSTANAKAIPLYESLGFAVRRETTVRMVQSPREQTR